MSSQSKEVQGKGRESRPKKWTNAIYGVFVLGATLLAYVVLIPRPIGTIDANPPDPNNPLSSPINITNSGLLPLHDVVVSIGLGEISGNGTAPTVNLQGQPNYKSRIQHRNWVPREMGPDDHFTLAFDQFMNFPSSALGRADLAIVIDYDLPIIHIRRTKIFPYYTRKLTNGGFAWYSDAPHTDSSEHPSN